jgi:FKBP-type peptidyl-prolyl cis-trans isomerase 2
MYSRSRGLGVLCSVVCMFIFTACQSTTGKTADQTVSDASISTAVQAELTRDRVSNFPRIDVDTERGIVYLSGIVETEAQRAQAERLAWRVEGVRTVKNNLQIQNRPPAGAQTPGTMDPRIVDGSKVTVQYVFIAPAFTGIGQGYVREFIQGRHQILPALEHEVTGMKQGEEKQVELPEEVFGPHDDTKIVKVPKSVLPAEAKEGDLLENANGELATVAEVSDTRAVLDYNHPLAGKQVVVQVKILKVEDP